MTKHIFVTGGVVSSLGKGLTSAAIGMILEQRGLKISIQKLDPYINVDPGTMSPYQHGEVYVTGRRHAKPIWTSATTNGSRTALLTREQPTYTTGQDLPVSHRKRTTR